MENDTPKDGKGVDKKVDDYFCASDKGGEGFAHLNQRDRDKIKSFYKSLLTGTLEEVEESVKGLTKTVSSRSFNQQLEDTSLAYNDALEDVISLIASHRGKLG